MDVEKWRRAVVDLDGKLGKFYEALDVEVPPGGWLRAIRHALGMTLPQFAKRLGRHRVTVREMEQREADQSITLKKLIEAGDALGLRFVYGFVPRAGSLDRLIDERALRLAGAIVRKYAPPLWYELHRIGGTRLRREIRAKADELRRAMPGDFWDQDRKKAPDSSSGASSFVEQCSSSGGR